MHTENRRVIPIRRTARAPMVLIKRKSTRSPRVYCAASGEEDAETEGGVIVLTMFIVIAAHARSTSAACARSTLTAASLRPRFVAQPVLLFQTETLLS